MTNFSPYSHMPPNSIPPQLSERTFRTYEAFIARGVLAFPTETRFDPSEFLDLSGKPLSGNTFAARMRDSITSLKTFGWETATVDIKKLWSISGQFSIAFDKDGAVWFRAKGMRGRPAHQMKDAREKLPSVDAGIDRLPWKEVSHEEVRSVCVLIHNARITGPIILDTPEQLSSEFVTTLETEYNVAIVYDEAGKKTVIN